MKRNSEWLLRSDYADASIKNQIKNSTLTISQKLELLRNISPIEETYKDMFDPFLINDMDIAVEKIISAIDENKKILIYGDYDCDGIFSTVSLYKFLKTLTSSCCYFIPNRFKDGYGLNMNRCFDILEKSYDLVITVDCGITSFDEIDFLTNAGIEVIVTDHHTCQERLPNAGAVIDCKRKDNTYPFQDLCGAGVALKLIQAICLTLNLGDVWKNYIEYTCIATVADVVPLVSENRIIVSEGINAIKNTNKEAIKALLAPMSNSISELSSIDIAFFIAPKINAASRMEDAKYATDLLLSEDKEQCENLARKLLELSDLRKATEKEIIKECVTQVIKNYDFNSLAPIVVYGDGWHAGVLGIVAAKIASLFFRPTIVLSKPKDSDLYTGSCRTFNNVNIYNLLTKTKKYLDRFGGHAKAAGLAIKKDNLSLFIEELKKVSCETLTRDDVADIKEADLETKLSDFSIKEIKNIASLGPFGENNPEPIFIAKNLIVRKIERLGKTNLHVKILVSDGKRKYYLTCFKMGECANFLSENDVIDILFKVNINIWQGKKSIQFVVQDIHSNSFVLQKEYFMDEDVLYRDNIISVKEIMDEYSVPQEVLLATPKEYSKIYAVIMDYFKNYCSSDIILCRTSSLVKYINNALHTSFNVFKVSRVLEVLNDAQYINVNFDNENNVYIILNNSTTKLPLGKTEAFKKLCKERN